MEEEIAYTSCLLNAVQDGVAACENKQIRELYDRIKTLLETDGIRQIRSKNDEDARFGHKTPTSTFFGYKNHIAMTEEGIITAVEVTDGAQPDGKQLPKLIEKSVQNGVDVKEVIGDMAYVSDQNLAECEEKDITLYAKTNSAVAAAAKCDLEEGFWLNKDAAALQCPAGELSVKATKKYLPMGTNIYNTVSTKRHAKNVLTETNVVWENPNARRIPLRE